MTDTPPRCAVVPPQGCDGRAACKALPDCSRPAVSTWRIRPRRDREPICREIQQATAWPGQSAPTSVAACGPCAGQVRDAAITVLSVVSVEEPVVVTEGEGE